jgi:hypothetical protein
MFRVFSNTLMTLNTSKTYSMPDTEDWQNVLKFKQFPLLPSTRKAFQLLMRKASLSFEGLARIAEQDPAICLHMILRIKQLNPTSVEQINTALGCISLLGMEEVVKLVKQLPVLEEVPRSLPERNYMAMLHTAVLAGQIAAQWAQFKPGLNQHQAQWSAMLASAPLWPWQLQQVSASQETFNQMSQGKDLIPALEASFGKLSKTRLGHWKKIADALALPNICRSLWQQQCWPKPNEWQELRSQKLTSIEGHRTLKHKCQQPEMLIYLANALASQYRFGAYRLKTKRWLALSSNFLNKDAHDIHKEVTSLNLQLARQGRGQSAIATLLAPTYTSMPECWVYQCQKQLAEFKMERDAPKAVSNTNITSHERKIDQPVIKRLMQQLSESPESFGDLHYLMRSVLKGITEGIGLKHAYIMVQNKLGTAAKVYYQQGLAETDPLCQFGIALDSSSVFKKMLEKPASLMITEHNRDKMLRGITEAQRQVLPQQFMMMSIFSNDRPIGIIFADLGNPPQNAPMQPSEYMAFKSICLAASKSLGKLAIATQKKKRIDNNKANRRQA